MERRALIAVVISVLILVLYQEVVMKRFYGSGPGTTPEPTAPPPVAPAAPAEVAPAPPAAPIPGPEAPAAVPAAGTDVVVDTDLYQAVFTTAGARLKSLALKRYRATATPDSPPLQMVQYPVDSKLPLGVALVGAQQLNDAAVLYRADQQQIDIPTSGQASLTFTGELAGATLRKRIEMRGDRYEWAMDVDIANPPDGYTEMALSWEEGMNPAGPKAAEVVFDSVIVLQGSKLQKDLFTALDAGKLLQNDIGWAAFSGRYFLAALVPQAEPENTLRVWARRTEQTVEAQILFPPKTFAAHADLYVGPKDIDDLEAAGHGLRRALDLGWFTFIALPMLQALRLLASLHRQLRHRRSSSSPW